MNRQIMHEQHTRPFSADLVAPSSSFVLTSTVLSQRNNIMNTTIDALTNLTAIPLTLLRTTANVLPRFSYVQVPHIKLKAEHQALVLFHIVKIGLAYWESWCDGKKNLKDEYGIAREIKEDARRKKRGSKTRRGKRVVGKGKYTIVFQ